MSETILVTHRAGNPERQPQPGNPLTSQDQLYLETDRVKVKIFLEGGGARRIMLNDLYRIYTTYFVTGFSLSFSNMDAVAVMLRDLYKRYDDWKSNNPQHLIQ